MSDLPTNVLLGRKLRDRGLTLVTAESCTGGLLAKVMTDIPGSSDYFRMGIVAYNNEIKSIVLDVPEEDIERYGAVSTEVAVRMASGATKISDSDIGISITGVAGPGGGTDHKPVGLAYVGVSDGVNTVAKKVAFEGDRRENRARFTEAAMILALQFLEDRLPIDV